MSAIIVLTCIAGSAAAQAPPAEPLKPPPTRPQLPSEPSLDNPALEQRPPKDANSDRAAQSALPPNAKQELDELYAKLAVAKTPEEAHPLEQRILQRLAVSGSATVDLLMSWTDKALAANDYPAALDLLDEALALKPDYVEGYNRRATIYYLLDDYTRSIGDIERTLSLEPRHFGALAGLGAVLTELDQPERARSIYERTLKINPQLTTVKEALAELDKRSAGRDL
ncbi:tetratricopeptide repeat protein [Chthonobacter albigriseus]|uniref:tetratricopeptide repeat protein n=1 Tax=Chthonobacter albigriseus TaxID=1683161 RepID=UPI0015EF5B10|nr:tetratricopeptide repeat protein [Chthonobacter albigriseus]